MRSASVSGAISLSSHAVEHSQAYCFGHMLLECIPTVHVAEQSSLKSALPSQPSSCTFMPKFTSQQCVCYLRCSTAPLTAQALSKVSCCLLTSLLYAPVEAARSCDKGGQHPLSNGGLHSGAQVEGRGAAPLHHSPAVPNQ